MLQKIKELFICLTNYIDKPYNHEYYNPCTQDLPTNTKNEWLNRQNEKLNKIPLCKRKNEN